MAAPPLNETWIHQAVRKVALRQLALAALLLVSVLIGFTVYNSYWRSFLHGPVDASFADLHADLSSRGDRQFLRVHGDKAFDTGMTQVTTHTMNGVETSKETSAYYYLLRVDDQPLLVKGKAITTTPEGNLVPVPKDLADDLLSGPSGARLKTVMFPYMLEASDPFRRDGYFAIVASLVALGCAFLLARRGMSRVGDPRTHPSVQWLESTGQVQAVATATDDEVRHSVVYKKQDITLTPNYVVRRAFFTFRIYPLDDLLWLYKQLVRQRVYFVPVGTTTQLLMTFRQKQKASMRVAAADADRLIQQIGARRPWAFYGYSLELKKFADDQAAITAAVDQRRAGFQGQARS